MQTPSASRAKEINAVKEDRNADLELPCFSEKLMVALRDGRKLIGVLRSWDQFGMLCLKIAPSVMLQTEPVL